MGPMGKVERVIATVAWTIVAAFLFAGFGMVFGSAVVRTLGAFGVGDEGALDIVQSVFRMAAGAGMLLVSRIYRMTAGEDNAGSVAAWLAGWTVLLFSGASLVARLDEGAAPVILATVLLVWTTVKLVRHFAAPDAGAPDERPPDERDGSE